MATSNLQQYTIADFLEWYRKKQLKLNPDFQRRSVWTQAAKSYLIDTILRDYPIPKIYIRSRIDLETKKSYREVVDGQQRLRAIIEFANGKLVLGSRAKEFKGHRYSTLPEDLQEHFLSYTVAVELLINASDEEVLEIFSRLNSYNVRLNDAELRHAEFQGEFKWAVYDTSMKWGKDLWERFSILSMRQRVRMLDDSLMAEMFGVVLEGVTDGGQRNIRKLYTKYDKDFPDKEETVAKVNRTIEFVVRNLAPAIDGPISRAPHFLMLYAAVAYASFGIPQGQMSNQMPEREPQSLSDIPIAIENLSYLSQILESDEPPSEAHLKEFWMASSGTTQRIASRRKRFPVYFRALLPQRL